MRNHRIIFGTLIILIIALGSLGANKADQATNSSGDRPKKLSAPDTLSNAKSRQSVPEVITMPSSAGEITFPHQQHVEDFEIECKSCHHEVNATKLEFPHEDYFDDFWIDCKICHHESGNKKAEAQACSNCHHKSPSNITDETLSATVVIHKNCWECHEVGTGAEASQSCGTCHTGPRTKRN